MNQNNININRQIKKCVAEILDSLCDRNGLTIGGII